MAPRVVPSYLRDAWMKDHEYTHLSSQSVKYLLMALISDVCPWCCHKDELSAGVVEVSCTWPGIRVKAREAARSMDPWMPRAEAVPPPPFRTGCDLRLRSTATFLSRSSNPPLHDIARAVVTQHGPRGSRSIGSESFQSNNML